MHCIRFLAPIPCLFRNTASASADASATSIQVYHTTPHGSSSFLFYCAVCVLLDCQLPSQMSSSQFPAAISPLQQAVTNRSRSYVLQISSNDVFCQYFRLCIFVTPTPINFSKRSVMSTTCGSYNQVHAYHEHVERIGWCIRDLVATTNSRKFQPAVCTPVNKLLTKSNIYFVCLWTYAYAPIMAVRITI